MSSSRIFNKNYIKQLMGKPFTNEGWIAGSTGYYVAFPTDSTNYERAECLLCNSKDKDLVQHRGAYSLLETKDNYYILVNLKKLTADRAAKERNLERRSLDYLMNVIGKEPGEVEEAEKGKEPKVKEAKKGKDERHEKSELLIRLEQPLKNQKYAYTEDSSTTQKELKSISEKSSRALTSEEHEFQFKSDVRSMLETVSALKKVGTFASVTSLHAKTEISHLETKAPLEETIEKEKEHRLASMHLDRFFTREHTVTKKDELIISFNERPKIQEEREEETYRQLHAHTF